MELSSVEPLHPNKITALQLHVHVQLILLLPHTSCFSVLAYERETLKNTCPKSSRIGTE